jgi:plasmid stabilization system protein ParE
MTYRIETTHQAADDRDRCFAYIAERSRAGAISWLEAYELAIDALAENPFRGLAPESVDHDEEIRQQLFKTRHGLTYRALFLIRGDVVFLLHVQGPGQDILPSSGIRPPSE